MDLSDETRIKQAPDSLWRLRCDAATALSPNCPRMRSFHVATVDGNGPAAERQFHLTHGSIPVQGLRSVHALRWSTKPRTQPCGLGCVI